MDANKSQDSQLVERLKSSGERVTSPRLHLFRILRQNGPISMASLRQKAKASGIDTVTVYRSVALFQKLSLVQEIGAGSNRMLELTDDFEAHHHHLWCTKCGQMLDFDDESLERSMRSAASRLNIRIESHQLEIIGVCATCLKLNAKASGQ